MPWADIEEALDAALLGQAEAAQATAEAACSAALRAGVAGAKPDWWNPPLRELKIKRAKAAVPASAARKFEELRAEGLVPGWAMILADVELIRLAAI